MRIQPHKICGFVGIYFTQAEVKGVLGDSSLYSTLETFCGFPSYLLTAIGAGPILPPTTRASSLRLQGERDL